ncbi:ech hydrogenase subunit B [Methanosarcina thermophila]|jgi:ech hydrogenase subunit B|uniref:Ech hydrogenase subunit B n=3 Tax=Methanosarcina thermophila TaxID=2210 RepID=A0A1I6YI43_METTE|nr:complex I subunit 1 family protein [Methanosarcina thermophila]ALK05287.1 MAG: Ech hydrogenase subunit EchB [Methanosarcina sp. 795]AKB14062.1 Energy-conserving hydrogenase (ferredoxin), subunit B [Methanosarcina thermophila TM-1]AKB15294.1 Energy-conserving hydrogenase (ferredoxin), subunit B [Methanosarcina thermophila CHTI-55]NLU56245.1 NADH-quinone oxidoreductase subunit H [Methanosarcina thermophila]SFT50153.1 ech hydrogenase subunit B [Methanosarcina thermophila]
MNATDILIAALVIFVAPIIGCLYAGIDRIITARLQGRVGPPLLQPYYDVKKLLSKDNMVVNPSQNFYVVIYVAFLILSLLMLVFQADILMIIFVYTVSSVALIVGGMSTGSPYARLGSSREIMAVLAYEPILILYALAIYLLTGTFKLSAVVQADKPLLFYTPLIFIAMFVVLNIKLKKSPFDYSTSHHAHQELVKGMTTEYSGPGLAGIEIGHFYEYVFLTGLIFVFWAVNPLIGILLSAAAFFTVTLIDNITARVYWQWMLKLSWSVLLILSIVNIAYLYFSQVKLV